MGPETGQTGEEQEPAGLRVTPAVSCADGEGLEGKEHAGEMLLQRELVGAF